jgi:hypothetical protein
LDRRKPRYLCFFFELLFVFALPLSFLLLQASELCKNIENLFNLVENGTCGAIDSSFAHGAVCPSAKFDIDTIEVWGCGGTQAELEQTQAKNRDSTQHNSFLILI